MGEVLLQSGIAEQCDCSTDNIPLHLNNVYKNGEPGTETTAEKTSVVHKEESQEDRHTLDHYSLDSFIALSFRVNSKKTTRFRKWATKILKEYITKGFVLNDELMKNACPFDRVYFYELIERIHEIRSSERRTYQKIADVFEQCSYDYNKDSEVTKSYYAAVWNNLLPECGKTDDSLSEIVFSKIINYAECAAENCELLFMQDWLDILCGFIVQEEK